MHFKSNVVKNINSMHGFTFIEVMAALMLIALLLAPLLFQQSNMLRNAAFVSRSLDHMFAAQTFLYKARAAMQEYTTSFSMQETIEDKDITLTFSREPVPKESAFAQVPYIYQDQVIVTWREDGDLRKEAFTTYVFVQPQEEGAVG